MNLVQKLQKGSNYAQIVILSPQNNVVPTVE